MTAPPPSSLAWSPEFSRRLRIAITRIGTLQAAAEAADCSADQVGKWRDGVARPALFPIARIAAAAGVSLDWLVGLEKPTSFRTVLRVKPWDQA